MKKEWRTETLKNDRSWISVYTVQYGTQTLQLGQIHRTKRGQHMINNSESASIKYKTSGVWHCTPGSVNRVTSAALHGRPCRCVPATEAGYHNRNLIEPFYSQEETRCIPSNNRHCLNIHVLLCDKSYTLRLTCVPADTSILMCTHSPGSSGFSFNSTVCACVHIFIRINHSSPQHTKGLLVDHTSLNPC